MQCQPGTMLTDQSQNISTPWVCFLSWLFAKAVKHWLGLQASLCVREVMSKSNLIQLWKKTETDTATKQKDKTRWRRQKDEGKVAYRKMQKDPFFKKKTKWWGRFEFADSGKMVHTEQITDPWCFSVSPRPIPHFSCLPSTFLHEHAKA